MDTSLLTSFVATAESGSVSSAARRLRVQISTVSRHVAEVERGVGVPLFDRTGRGVRLTPAGERYLERVRHALLELEHAAADARGERGASIAHLRLSAPLELALRILPAVLDELSRLHPDLGVDVHTDARRVSLLEEDYDAAIRIGALGDTSLIARSLGAIPLYLCGRAGAPPVRRLSDLASVELVRVASTPDVIEVEHRGRRTPLHLRGRYQVSTFSEAASLVAIGGERVAVLPAYTAVEHITAGSLVRLLPSVRLPRAPVHLVHGPRLRGSAVARDLGDALTRALAHAERALLAGGAPKADGSA